MDQTHTLSRSIVTLGLPKINIQCSVRYQTLMSQYLRILRDRLAFNYISLSTDAKSITKRKGRRDGIDDEESNITAFNRFEWELEKSQQEEIRSMYPGSTETKVGANIFVILFISRQSASIASGCLPNIRYSALSEVKFAPKALHIHAHHNPLR